MRIVSIILCLIISLSSCGPFYTTRYGKNSKRVFSQQPKVNKKSRFYLLPLEENDRLSLDNGFEVIDKKTIKKFFNLQYQDWLTSAPSPYFEILLVNGNTSCSFFTDKDQTILFGDYINAVFRVYQNEPFIPATSLKPLDYAIIDFDTRESAIIAYRWFQANNQHIYKWRNSNKYQWLKYSGKTTYRFTDKEYHKGLSRGQISAFIYMECGVATGTIGEIKIRDDYCEFEILSDEPLQGTLKYAEVLKPYQKFESFEIIILGEKLTSLQSLMKKNEIEFKTTANNK